MLSLLPVSADLRRVTLPAAALKFRVTNEGGDEIIGSIGSPRRSVRVSFVSTLNGLFITRIPSPSALSVPLIYSKPGRGRRRGELLYSLVSRLFHGAGVSANKTSLGWIVDRCARFSLVAEEAFGAFTRIHQQPSAAATGFDDFRWHISIAPPPPASAFPATTPWSRDINAAKVKREKPRQNEKPSIPGSNELSSFLPRPVPSTFHPPPFDFPLFSDRPFHLPLVSSISISLR